MVPFLLAMSYSSLLVPLKYPWRSLLFTLHGRGGGEGPFSMHRLNGFTCTWSVLSLLGVKQRTELLSRSDSRKKMRGR